MHVFLIMWKEENFVSILFKYIPNIKLLIDLNNGDYFMDFSFLIKEVHSFCEERNFKIFHWFKLINMDNVYGKYLFKYVNLI